MNIQHKSVVTKSVVTGNSQSDWNGRKRITLKNKRTAVCQGLRVGKIYGVFFYNVSDADHKIDAPVVRRQGYPSVQIKIPGKTGNQD